MASIFPSKEWLDELHIKLNTDPQYARIAHNWEGDVALIIEADHQYPNSAMLYLDLWHGKSRQVEYFSVPDTNGSAFVISAPFSNWVRILRGELNPIQAMATMKLKVRGNLAYIMRNVPTVLDFTRCAQETPHIL